MSEDHEINSVNKHYLDKVMNLAEERDIKATEDIYDARGMKLVAKGALISRNLQEKLILHRLRKPFESSIAVDGGVDTNVIVTEARRILDTVQPVRNILDAVKAGAMPLQILSQIQFGNAMSTMLTIVERGGAAALSHSVMVSLVSLCLAKKFRLSGNDQMTVALAGLLHDIGELYIEPEYLNSKKRFFPHEWRHIVVHPRIGQMLISELESYPPGVAQAVFEHHERLDGAGYPRQISGNNISLAGQIVSVAEMISGVFMNQDKPLERAELALKIIPGEHAHDLISVVSHAMQNARTEKEDLGTSTPSGEEHESVQRLHDRIASVLQAGQELIESPLLKSKKVNQLLTLALRRTTIIERAFISTGLDASLHGSQVFFETHGVDVLFEAAVATREIQWRLRDVARDLSLHAAVLETHETEALQPLIALLDGEH